MPKPSAWSTRGHPGAGADSSDEGLKDRQNLPIRSMALFRRSDKQDDMVVDRVTGAFNRRQLDADIASGLDTSDQPTATLLISVDDFPAYTGKKGVASGDQVLERVSWVIMATVRTTDVVYRHARDSFCVLLPATSDADAFAVASRIRSNVERMPLLAESRVTVSVGVATGAGTDLASTIQRADEALSSGASTGSNQVFAERRVTENALSAAPSPAAPASPVAPQPAPSAGVQPNLAPPSPMHPPASAPFAPPSI